MLSPSSLRWEPAESILLQGSCSQHRCTGQQKKDQALYLENVPSSWLYCLAVPRQPALLSVSAAWTPWCGKTMFCRVWSEGFLCWKSWWEGPKTVWTDTQTSPKINQSTWFVRWQVSTSHCLSVCLSAGAQCVWPSVRSSTPLRTAKWSPLLRPPVSSSCLTNPYTCKSVWRKRSVHQQSLWSRVMGDINNG